MSAPFDLDGCVADFQRDGYVHIPGVLSPEESGALRGEVETLRSTHPWPWTTRWFHSGVHLHLRSMLGLIDRTPLIDMAERLLVFEPGVKPGGPEGAGDEDLPPTTSDCHLINVSVNVTDPGDPGHQWHIDDNLYMPRPAHVPWDDRIPFPVYLVTAMVYLTRVGPEDGPTELVPGSQRSGRRPEPWDAGPRYDGRGPLALQVEVGDCILFHNQVWHHALPHEGAEPRCVAQVHYGARFIAPRLGPFPNQHVPSVIRDGLNARQRRLLGEHPALGQYT